jgi:hypothetical protein
MVLFLIIRIRCRAWRTNWFSTISLDAIEQIQVATAPYDVTLSGFTELLLTQLQNQGQMNFTVRLMLFRNQDLTGSKRWRYICSIIRTNPSRRKYWGPIVKNKLFFFANFEIDKRSDSGSNFVANDGIVQQGSTNREF